jgi:hypothetical protein
MTGVLHDIYDGAPWCETDIADLRNHAARGRS